MAMGWVILIWAIYTYLCVVMQYEYVRRKNTEMTWKNWVYVFAASSFVIFITYHFILKKIV